MAKPPPVASTDSPGTSKSTICRTQDAAEPSYRTRHRRHRIPKPSSSFVAPSSGLLVLLASVTSATTANGSPAPPTFLCPSIDLDGPCAINLNKRASSSTSSVGTPTSTDSAIMLAVARSLPDRYDKDADGMWRRVPSYTLYGSTVSATCDGTCLQPTDAVSTPTPADDQIQVSNVRNSTATTNSSAAATTTDDIQDSLPPGWKSVPKPYEKRTSLILALSLVLAFFICSFIIGCLFWRKSVKKRHKSNDVEAKARKKRDGNEEEEDTRELMEKEAKSKQKVWARATARWKANVRLSARQRRGKRLGSRLSYAHQSSLSVDQSRSRLGGSTPSMRSKNSSRRSSIVSIPDQLEEARVASASTLQEQATLHAPPTPMTPASPPAYQHPPQISTTLASSDTASSDRSRRPSHSFTYTTSTSINDVQSADLSPPTPMHAAHVATDDKALLARLADLASSPPPDTSSSVGMSEAQVSAPVWHDEGIEGLASDLILPPAQSSDPIGCSPPMFPLPPSKDQLAAAELYTYPFSFDEMESLEAEAEPSAPPFEEGPLPPLPHSHLLPSAPPLLDADEFLQGSHPTAPEWDPTTELDPREQSASGQDHDRIATESTVSGPPSFLANPTPGPTNDNIALPGYKP